MLSFVMAIKIKTNINLKKQLQGATSKSSKKIKTEIVEEILKDYNKGISPVKGFNQYKAYKPSTAKKKGRKKPVTLKESGNLHDSLTAIQKSNTRIELTFRGAKNKRVASYHQYGTENMDARPMLPSRGQEFKKRVIDKMRKIIRSALDKIS